MQHAQRGAISAATRIPRHSSRSVCSPADRGVVEQRDVLAAAVEELVADLVAHGGDLRVLFGADDESIQDVAADDTAGGVAGAVEDVGGGGQLEPELVPRPTENTQVAASANRLVQPKTSSTRLRQRWLWRQPACCSVSPRIAVCLSYNNTRTSMISCAITQQQASALENFADCRSMDRKSCRHMPV